MAIHSAKGSDGPKRSCWLALTAPPPVSGLDSQLQVGVSILGFEMDGLRRAHRLADAPDAPDARDAYEAVLHEEAAIELDDAEQRIVDILLARTPEGEDSGGVMAGGAWFIGAASCPNIRRVQGMEKFAEAKDDFYFQLAANFILKPDFMGEWTDATDLSTAAATSWFCTRERLPSVLERWRTDGARRIRIRGQRPRTASVGAVAPRNDAAIRQRQEAGAALRKGRRKKR